MRVEMTKQSEIERLERALAYWAIHAPYEQRRIELAVADITRRLRALTSMETDEQFADRVRKARNDADNV